MVATVSVSPTSSLNVVGSNVVFNCIITGYRPPSSSLQWYKDSDLSDPLTTNQTNIVNERTTQLILTELTMEDAGKYICSLVLQRNFVLQDRANLTVGSKFFSMYFS